MFFSVDNFADNFRKRSVNRHLRIFDVVRILWTKCDFVHKSVRKCPQSVYATLAHRCPQKNNNEKILQNTLHFAKVYIYLQHQNYYSLIRTTTMAASKNNSLRQQMLNLMGTMKLGETRRVHIPHAAVDSIRTASYKVGRFAFAKVSGEPNMRDLTRLGIEQKSLRALVRASMKKGAFPATFAYAGLNNVRNYVRQYDEEFGTIHRVEPSAAGIVVTRDLAAEHCAALLAVLNDRNSSAGAIATALAVLSSYCKAEQARRFA
jgi:hypothetical protein